MNRSMMDRQPLNNQQLARNMNAGRKLLNEEYIQTGAFSISISSTNA
jgi:hypothetical protein